MSDSVQPHRRQPTRLPCPWDSPSKNTGVGCHFLLQCMKVKSESEVAHSCLTLSNPMDCSPPGSSVHGIFQARVLEWGAIAFSVKNTRCYLSFVKVFLAGSMCEISVSSSQFCCEPETGLLKLSLIKGKGHSGELSFGLVVRILGFHSWGPGSVPGRGTEILQAVAWPKNKQKKVTL